MSFFSRIFRRKRNIDIPPIPSRDAIIEMLYDQHLDTFTDEVIDVIYSNDRSMRYVILKENNGLFTYQLEAIYQFNEDEWRYIRSNDHAIPATWEPLRGVVGKSFFNNIEALRKDIENEPEFKQYF